MPRTEAKTPPSKVRLTVGDVAPDFNLSDADGRAVALSGLRKKCKVIVYFYPAAMTPGCTTESCDFRDAEQRLLDAGYVVVGISPDNLAKLNQFRDTHHFAFPLLSDPELKAHVAYGTWGEKQLYGKTVVGVIRSTFVIDEEGRIAQAMYGHKATGHVERLLRLLEVN